MSMTLWYIESSVESTALIECSNASMLKDQTCQEVGRQKKTNFSHKNAIKIIEHDTILKKFSNNCDLKAKEKP